MAVIPFSEKELSISTNEEGICTVHSPVIFRLLLLNDLNFQITSLPSLVAAYGPNILRKK